MLEPLAARNIVPQTDLLQARRELNDVQGRLAAAREGGVARQRRHPRGPGPGQRSRVPVPPGGAQRAQPAHHPHRGQPGSARGAAGRLQRSEIRSPVDGVVNDIQMTTIGGFVNAGQKIMEVVPMGERLLVETRVRPSDIAFIRVGDRALVKVAAYDFSTYGGLEARVVQVGADSSYDEQTREAYFTVVVETDRSWLQAGNRRLPITPGMMCDVDIITGRKSILNYLLNPVLTAWNEGLRER